MPNEADGVDTALPEEATEKMKALPIEYNAKKEKTFEDILDFHVKFERVHPFQDGSGIPAWRRRITPTGTTVKKCCCSCWCLCPIHCGYG